MTSEERRGLLFVALAVAFFSTSPLFIIWAAPLPPVVITWGRMLVAAVAVWLMLRFILRARSSTEAASGEHTSIGRFLGYGLIAALHFLFYIASLSFTTVAHSLAIIYTAPIFVTLLSAWLLGEPIRRRQWAGVAVAVAGVAIVSGFEPRMDPRMAFGDFLALLSSITFGFYSVAGRYERGRHPLLVYAWRVYGAAALWLLPAAAAQLPEVGAVRWGWQQVGSIVALGLGPLALGHTLYNAALRRVHATYVNTIASQEVTGGIVLSWLLLGQVPSANSLVGALITLVGIALVLR